MTAEEDAEEKAQAFFPESGPDKNDMTASYLPDDDEWLAKTHLDVGDAAAIAALSELGTMFPEVDDLQPLVDGFLEEYLKGKISENDARDEFKDILVSMHGGNVGENKGSGMVVNALAPEEDD